MNIFKTLAALLSAELTATIVIKKTANGKMTVITNFTTEKGGVCDTLAPFTLKGTPEELDEGYLEAIKAPVETVNGLVSNLAAFQKSAQQAEKNAKTAASKPAPTSGNDAVKKMEAERKRKEAEAKAKKENFEKAMAEAKAANAHGNYFTAEALFNFAATLTDDKKVKADIAKMIKTIAPNKEGFLCNDNEEAAKAALEKFQASMVKPQVEEAPAEQKEAPVTESPEEATDTEEETSENEETGDNENGNDIPDGNE